MTDSLSSMAALRALARADGPRAAAHPAFASGYASLDTALGGGLARGRLHEIFAHEADAGVAAGFAAMLAVRAVQPSGALLWLRTERAEARSGGLYAPGLAMLGVEPDDLLLAVMADDVALLKAAADALRCAALGAVVIECWGSPRALDLTATRRLSVAAAASGVPALMLRLDAEPMPSAAETRWRVTPGVSAAMEADAQAPGHPVLELELLRRRSGPAGATWRVEWTHDARAFRAAPLPGAVVPAIADRPTADRQPLRRAA